MTQPNLAIPASNGATAHLLTATPDLREALPVAAYACDGNGRILWFNSRAEKLWGRSPLVGDETERFCGSYRLFFNGREIDREETPMAHAIRTGQVVTGAEGIVERPDGSRVWAMVHIAPVKDDSGNIIGAVNCFHDTTETHRIGDTLQEKQDELEDFFDNAPMALHIVAGDGIIVRANKAELELLGYEADEYIGRPITDFHADSDTISDILACLGRGEKLTRHKARLLARDGSIRHVQITSSPRMEDGRFVNTRCFTQDVTSEVLANRHAADAEYRCKQILEALPAAVYTTDPQGRITYYNNAAVEMSGRAPELGTDKWCVTWRLYNPDGTPLPHDQCPMAIALKENRAIRGAEAIAERPDGTRVWFAPYPTPLRDASGHMTGAINMLVDITHRKEAESQQRLLIDELNHRVKNTLATVQSIIGQTARNARDVGSYREAIEARIMAVSRAHNQLSRCNWGQTLLREVVTSALEAHAESGKIVLTGPPVKVAPRTALMLSMVFNELATNAAKYGALNSNVGSVALDWSVKANGAGPLLAFQWRERGGPAPHEPGATGFGMRLIQRGIEMELQGRTVIDFAPNGLRCEIEVPLVHAAGD